MPTLPVYAADFCRACLNDDHSKEHGRIGCLVRVGRPPRDFVCACEVKRGPVVLSALPPIDEEDEDA